MGDINFENTSIYILDKILEFFYYMSFECMVLIF